MTGVAGAWIRKTEAAEQEVVDNQKRFRKEFLKASAEDAQGDKVDLSDYQTNKIEDDEELLRLYVTKEEEENLEVSEKNINAFIEKSPNNAESIKNPLSSENQTQDEYELEGSLARIVSVFYAKVLIVIGFILIMAEIVFSDQISNKMMVSNKE